MTTRSPPRLEAEPRGRPGWSSIAEVLPTVLFEVLREQLAQGIRRSKFGTPEVARQPERRAA